MRSSVLLQARHASKDESRKIKYTIEKIEFNRIFLKPDLTLVLSESHLRIEQVVRFGV